MKTVTSLKTGRNARTLLFSCLRKLQSTQTCNSTTVTRTTEPRLTSSNIIQEKREDFHSGDRSAQIMAVVEGLHDGKIALKEKSTSEILRALVVLRFSSINFFVDHSENILIWTKWILREKLFNQVLKRTFFGQFCAGESLAEVEKKFTTLKHAGLRSMVCVPIESTASNAEDLQKSIDHWEKNTQIMMDCIEKTDELDKGGFTQLKMSALCSPQLLLAMNEGITKYDKHRTPESEWDIGRVSSLISTGNYKGIKIDSLDDTLNQDLRHLFRRCYKLGEACQERGLRLMIDAEQTYIQAALNYIVLVLQAVFNKDIPVIYNTYQCYRKDTLNRIKADHQLSKQLNFKIAGKLVRGAYLEEERKRSQDHGYPDPINDSYADTTAMYLSAVDYLLPYIAVGNVGIMIASHNEDTVEHVVNRMQEFNLAKDTESLCFAQIFGMCDHVSYSLGKFGYQVYKSIPYGTVDQTLLYLCRRAKENRSVMSRSLFERQLLKGELKKRMFQFGQA